MPFSLSADLGFTRLFGASADLEFASADGPVTALTLAITLPGLQPTLALSTVNPATLAITLPGLQPALLLSTVNPATWVITLPGLQPTLTLSYDNNVWRGPLGDTQSGTQDGQPLPGTVAGHWQQAQTETLQPRLPWRAAAPGVAATEDRAQPMVRDDAPQHLRFAGATPLGNTAGSSYYQMRPNDATDFAPWQGGVAIGTGARADWIQLLPQDRNGMTRWREALARSRSIGDRAQQGIHQWRGWRGPWQAGQPVTGISVPVVIPPEPPQPPFGDANLNFLYRFALTAGIEFVRSLIRRIPLRRTYFVLHEIVITRVSDGAALEFADLTLSADTGSWGWSLSGNALGATTFARLTAAPFTEINVRLNGIDWRFLITSVSHSRAFGKTGYAVTGMSPALALTAPLSDARTRQIADPWTVSQLADQEVVDTAWAIDWQAPDWPVPGGVWQYAGQTPMQVIGSLAEAAGAFVQAERVNRILQVRPRYPAWPWSSFWATPDLEWPLALARDLKKAPQAGANYNAVYAAGTVAGGLMGYVKRAGTAGDVSPGAPLTNLLITHADAARAFGGTYLADQQDQVDVSFNTTLGGDAPLAALASRIDLTEPGQPPLAMLTQAVSLSVQRGNQAVTITQSVKGVAF